MWVAKGRREGLVEKGTSRSAGNLDNSFGSVHDFRIWLQVVRDGFLVIVAGPGNEEFDKDPGEREGRV